MPKLWAGLFTNRLSAFKKKNKWDSPNGVSPKNPSVQMGVVQMGVVQMGIVQMGVVQLGVVRLGVVQMGVDLIIEMDGKTNKW